MATTTNYGWETADDTDLVKDGALAMRTLGSAIDTTVKALNPSTTLGDIEYRSATANTNTRLPIGTAGQVLTVAAGVPSWATAGGSSLQVFSVHDAKTSGTDAGTFTSGGWRTRTLNTSLLNTVSGASLGSNQITLPAGTYFLQATAPSYKTNSNNLRWYNITDSALVALGANNYAGTTNEIAATAVLNCTFTIAASKVFELQHYGAVTQSGNGFGVSGNLGYTEMYAQLTIIKVA
jgi:hypothetical protein